MTIGWPLDPREHAYGIFGEFAVPDDGDFYVIQGSGWMVSRIQVYTTAGALGSVNAGGGLIAVGSVDSGACLELRPDYLLRGPVVVHHNAGTGGEFRVVIEYAWDVNPQGIQPPVSVTS